MSWHFGNGSVVGLGDVEEGGLGQVGVGQAASDGVQVILVVVIVVVGGQMFVDGARGIGAVVVVIRGIGVGGLTVGGLASSGYTHSLTLSLLLLIVL